MAETAPFYARIADAPDGEQAFWARTEDGTRIRVAIWAGQKNGTVLLFPGRSEYIEKYGLVVGELVRRGLNVVVIDWRGQGLSDRDLPGRTIGYVEDFLVYQQDMQTMLALDEVKALPGPRVLLSHSMGGCIALRALLNGLDVRGSIFSAPMWDLYYAPLLRPFAKALIHVGPHIGLGKRRAPGTSEQNYVIEQEFEGNVLTSDEENFARLKRNLIAQPDLSLGGPSLRWLLAADHEMKALSRTLPPDVPALSLQGDADSIVVQEVVHALTARFNEGEVLLRSHARHELLMETPSHRRACWDKIDAFLMRLGVSTGV